MMKSIIKPNKTMLFLQDTNVNLVQTVGCGIRITVISYLEYMKHGKTVKYHVLL